MTYVPKDMVEAMRDALKREGIKHKDFAKMMDVSPAFVSSVLTGNKPPNRPMMKFFGIRKMVVYTNVEGK